MFGRVYAARYTERLLRGGDWGVIDPPWTENLEPGAEPGSGEKRQPGAARAAVQIHAKHRRKRPHRTADAGCERGRRGAEDGRQTGQADPTRTQGGTRLGVRAEAEQALPRGERGQFLFQSRRRA